MKTYTPENIEIFEVSALEFLNAESESWQAERLAEAVGENFDGDAEDSEVIRQVEAERLAGWYWWACSPGCLPDSEASGPFETELEAIEDAGGGEYEEYVIALAEEIGESPADITEESWECYGLKVLSCGRAEYAIGTDEEADAACREYVESSAWAFNASFVLSECGLPLELEDAIQAFQSKECESANDAIVALIEKACGMEAFTESAIAADGRGHFLASYDGEEMELDGNLYAYRIN